MPGLLWLFCLCQVKGVYCVWLRLSYYGQFWVAGTMGRKKLPNPSCRAGSKSIKFASRPCTCFRGVSFS